MIEVNVGTSKSLANKPGEIMLYLEKHGSWHQTRGREHIKFDNEISSISVIQSPLSLKWKNYIISYSPIKTESIFKSSFT